MIALYVNGCQRKIIIDDLFPVDKYNNMLCSMTTNRGELWVSLLEKAYMKVMGGYDFPGSNSNIDLHALTGWIPERVSMLNTHEAFKAIDEFERLFERFHLGHCLITIATGELNKQEEERTGLVSTHAYACLDIRKFKSQRLFQLKNPWSHIRWKGNYSELDTRNWTQELKSALNFDPALACNVDNGVFWIDYESLMKFFDVIYISWNPSIFPFTSLYHRKWSVNEGPIKDRYSFGENPQYVLSVKNPDAKKFSIWILLTRHIVDKADFAHNKEYITLIVYKNNGKRVYYPSNYRKRVPIFC
jgi:calpain-7